MTFAAGIYEVRYAAKKNYDASPVKAVTISEGRMLAVTLPQAEEQVGYTLTAGKEQLAWKEGTTLTFALAPGCSKLDNFAVKAVYTGNENNAGNVNITDNGDGTYTISEVTEDVKVMVEGVADITAPTAEIAIGTNTWNQFRNDVTFGLFLKDKQTVTIVANDTATQTPEIRYYLSDKILTETEIKADDIIWQPYTDVFDIPAGEKKIIYAKAADQAGNVTIVNSEGIIVYRDSTPMEAGITAAYQENSGKSVAISLNGNTIKAITDGKRTLTKGTDYSVSADGEDTIITIKTAYLDSLAASDTPYDLTVIYNPQGVEYTGGANSVAPGQSTISVMITKSGNAPNQPDNTMNVDYTKEKVSDITTLPEGWTWQDADKDKELIAGTPVKATAVYIGADKGNYAVESVEISITRQVCDHKGCETEVVELATATPQPPKKGDVVQDDKASAKVEVADVTKKEVAYKKLENQKAKTVSIPETVTIDGVAYKVTKIGANAFNGCKKLKTITIKSTKLSSKTVAKNTFKGLTKATTIKVPKKKLEAYKKLFKQKGLSSDVKVVGY